MGVQHIFSLYFLPSLLVFSFFVSAENSVTKGQVTEAIFILQNKQQELAEYIQKLKKKLTDCFAQQKKLLDSGGSCADCSQKELELNQCALFQKLFPSSIKELESVSAQALERIASLSKQNETRSDELRKEVDRAFLIKDKIELESSLIDLLITLDKNDWEISAQQKRMPKKYSPYLQRLKRDCAFNKKRLHAKKVRLAKINKTLYKENVSERVFLDELKTM